MSDDWLGIKKLSFSFLIITNCSKMTMSVDNRVDSNSVF